MTIHAGAQIPFATASNQHYKKRESNKYWLVPNIKAEFQRSSRTDTLATLQTYSWGAYIQTPYDIYGGIFFQHSNLLFVGADGGLNAPAFTLVAGFEARVLDAPVIVGISYDTQPLGLPTSVSGGSFEFSLRIKIEEAKAICNPEGRARRWYNKSGRYIMDCNNFF